jgi:hypothetical protein
MKPWSCPIVDTTALAVRLGAGQEEHPVLTPMCRVFESR